MRWHSWMTHKPGISLRCKGQFTFEKVTHMLTQFIIVLEVDPVPSGFCISLKPHQISQKQIKLSTFWDFFTLKPMNTQRFWFLLYSISPMRVASFQEEDTGNTVDDYNIIVSAC